MKTIRMEDLKDEFFCYEEFEDLPGVEKILSRIKQGKDKAVRKLTYKFDGVRTEEFRVKEKEVQDAYSSVQKDLIGDLKKRISPLSQPYEGNLSLLLKPDRHL